MFCTGGPAHNDHLLASACTWAQVPPYLDKGSEDSEEQLVAEDDFLQQELRRRQQEVDRCTQRVPAAERCACAGLHARSG